MHISDASEVHQPGNGCLEMDGPLKMLRRPERMPYDRHGIAKVPPIKSA